MQYTTQNSMICPAQMYRPRPSDGNTVTPRRRYGCGRDLTARNAAGWNVQSGERLAPETRTVRVSGLTGPTDEFRQVHTPTMFGLAPLSRRSGLLGAGL